MSTYGNSGLLGKLVTWFVIGVVAVIALKVGLALAGVIIGIGFTMLFTIGPILLVGWLVIKGLRYLSRDRNEFAV